MTFKKIVPVFAAAITLSLSALAMSPKSGITPEKPSTTQSGTAVYLFIGQPGDDVNDPNNYALTPITNPGDECGGGPDRCAATFQLNGSNQRTGTPQLPVYNKVAE